MIGDPYEDDTHFCLKCHATIIGLDNYVNHRKSVCSKNVDISKSPLPSQLLPPDESFGLKADDFFSSLELQSSSKKMAPSASGKSVSGILTRSKTTAAIQATSSTHKENLQQQEIPQSKSGKNVWIGGHQLKLGHGDNQSKLIKAVHNLERRKEEVLNIDVYQESDIESDDYDYDDDESSEDEHQDGPPRHHTGGKWKPSSPIQWSRSDWSVPSPTHTGGKWKPALVKRGTSPPPSHTRGKWKPPSSPLPTRDHCDYPPPSFTGSKWSQSKIKHEIEAPPTTHTKGKWKPEEVPIVRPKPRNIMPSPNYTKGKWIPEPEIKKPRKIIDDSPFRKSSGTVQYYCRPCDRRLASKTVYERHLKSELHFKRTLHDNELDDNFLSDKRKKKSTDIITITNPAAEPKQQTVKFRNRKKIYIKCEVCKSRVNSFLIGKHLISHYHCRKGDIASPAAKNMVLQYFQSIVLQSPFQCGICKYYFNQHSDFLDHWLSESHAKKVKSTRGYFWCSFCNYRSESGNIMYSHLLSIQHKEVVAAINRSVPIIIKRINPINCEECDEEFLLHIALKKHCQDENHKSSLLMANINNYTCVKCQRLFRSNVSLRRHKIRVHGEDVFICTVCNKNFSSKLEAKVHRNTKEHRYAVLARDNEKGLERKCDYCENIYPNLASFKQHLIAKHPNFCPRCIKCGTAFAIPQDLTAHLRSKSCTYNESLRTAKSCNECPFFTESTSELLFHQVLHTLPLIEESETSGKKPILKYKCPLCEAFFPKYSLPGHLRLHTEERPYVCTICNKGFVRKNNWAFHMKNHGTLKTRKTGLDLIRTEIQGDKPYLCSTCGKSFQRKSVLQQHMTVHTGKIHRCPKLECIFVARSVSELKVHFQTHSEAKNYPCKLCNYRSKTSQQLRKHMKVHSSTKKFQCSKCSFSCKSMTNLKRHMRLHTGSKPFNCPHCPYKCSNLENLRKHILSTGKHPGKYVYECKICTNSLFQTNFATEFKAHLVTRHSSQFKSQLEAASYVAGIYDASQDEKLPPESYSEEEIEVVAGEDEDQGSIKPTVIILNKPKDPLVTSSTSFPKDIIIEDNNVDTNADQALPMYIVSKDAPIENMAENWNFVEESGTMTFNLIPILNDQGVLFQEHLE